MSKKVACKQALELGSHGRHVFEVRPWEKTETLICMDLQGNAISELERFVWNLGDF